MKKPMGWLHLSDLHFLDKHDWQNSPVLEKLLKDLTALRSDGLQVDLVFCTGDISFGETSTETLENQYADAKGYFGEVLKICELPTERFFLVPGNHDIDRKQVLGSQTEYFRNSSRNSDQINQKFRDRDIETQRAMERLSKYRKFLTESYAHIALDENINFGACEEVNGIHVSIAGLNSAWTCADDKDRGQLWLAGEAQLGACKKAILAKSGGNGIDLRIGLIHHHLDWFNPQEAAQLRGRIENDFDFLLHGHTHDQWVKENATPYHIVIASGAAAAETEAEFGYNLVQLKQDKATIHLKRYDRKGDGWVNEDIANRAKNGIWPIQLPDSFAAPVVKSSAPPPTLEVPCARDNPPRSGGAKERGHFGLDNMLALCSETLKQYRLVFLYGIAGVGKTVIVEELYRLPEWRGLRHIPFTVTESSGLTDLFGALATHLGLHDERPVPPVGSSPQEMAEKLCSMASQANPFFLHVQRGQLWFSGGKWRREVEAMPHLLTGLMLAYPGSAIILETREEPESVKSIEACGLPRDVLNDYFAHPPGLDSASWVLNKDQRAYVFQRLGGGHGRGAHAYGLYLLAQLAAAKGVRPDEVLKLHSDDYAEALYTKLFRDLYENVLSETERNLLFACSLYRNGLHYSHLSRLERSLSCADIGAALIRRRLLTEDNDWFYLHDLAAEQARTLAGYEGRTRALQQTIAGFWLTDLQGQRTMIEANIRRALEALHHLEQAGEGERITEIAHELFGRRPDEAAAILWRLEGQLIRKGNADGVRVVLEYILKLKPDEHRAMRFLGECRRKLFGKKDRQAFMLFRAAKDLDPGFPDYWSNYGYAAIDCGDDALTEFLQEAESATRRVINDHYFVAIRATALQEAGRGDEASHLRTEALNTASRSAHIYADEAKYLLDAKHDPKGALAILDKARSNGCVNDITEAIRATALQEAGRGDEASHLRTEAINTASSNAHIYADEAKYLLDAKHDPKGALVILDKARSNGCANDTTEAIRATVLQALQ